MKGSFKPTARMLPRVGQRQTDQGVAELDASLAGIGKREIVNGRLIEGIEVPSSGEFEVAHGLGRKPRGWAIASLDTTAPCPIYEVSRDAKRLTFGVAAAAADPFSRIDGIVTTIADGTTTSSHTGVAGAPGWTAARTGVGVYVVTMSVDYTTFVGGAALLVGAFLPVWHARIYLYTTGAPSGVQIRTYNGAAAADVISGEIAFRAVWEPGEGATYEGQSVSMWVF